LRKWKLWRFVTLKDFLNAVAITFVVVMRALLDTIMAVLFAFVLRVQRTFLHKVPAILIFFSFTAILHKHGRYQLYLLFLQKTTLLKVGRVSVVATGWTDGGSNPGGGEIFRTSPDRPLGPPSSLYNGYRVSFPRVRRPGNIVDHPPHLAPRLKESVELYLYYPSVRFGLI
jgi:hypothetical protein